MKKYFMFLLLLLNLCFLTCQSIHIKYVVNISDISYTFEDTYYENGKIISVLDSIIIFDKEHFDKSTNFIKKGENYKTTYIKSINDNNVLIKKNFNGKEILVQDNIPKVEWNIDYKKQKKILDYNCYFAKTTYRGSNIIVYFTKEIPHNISPYKFINLPGTILEISEENNDYNNWKAIKINTNNKKNILPFTNNMKESMSIKEFVALEEKQSNEIFEKLTKNLPENAKAIKNTNRFGIEKKYEWE